MGTQTYNQEIYDWFNKFIRNEDIIYFRRCFEQRILCLLYYFDDDVSLIGWQDNLFEWAPLAIDQDEAVDIMIDCEEALGE